MLFSKKSAGVDALVVGLGNPGLRYRNTRHNVGFCAVDYIADKLGVRPDKSRFDALYCKARMGGKNILLIKPQTFMNESGRSVGSFARFFKIPPQDILVIFDDVSLDVGRLRIRRSGSAGGHNGIKSLIAHLGSQDFPRIKIGVGQKPHAEDDLADWVLGTLPPLQRETIAAEMPAVYDAVCDLLDGNAEAAMAKYN